MQININGKFYDVLIERKRIKNTYIKVKEDLIVHVSTNYFTSDMFIKKLIKKKHSFNY